MNEIFRFLIFSFLGSIIGFITGLIPSLHQNILIPLFITIFSVYEESIIVCFLISLAIAQNFGNSISSYYLSSPPEELSLSTLPSQRLAKSGLLLEALRIYILSATISMPITCFFVYFFHSHLSTIVSSLREYIGLILIVAIYTIFFFENNKLKSLIIFISSGLLGLICFNLIDFNRSILAMFTGFFSLSQAILNLFEKENFLKNQKENVKINLDKKQIFLGIIIIIILGVVSGLLPALGPSQMLLIFQPFLNDRMFIFLNSGLMFSNEVFSTASSYTIGNPRSGLSSYLEVKLKKIEYEDFVLILSNFLLSTFFGSMLFLISYRKIFNFLKGINFKIINLLTIFLIIFIIFSTSGIIGLIVLFTSTSLSLITMLLDVKRSYLMGCLIFSTILIYTNLYSHFLSFFKL